MLSLVIVPSSYQKDSIHTGLITDYQNLGTELTVVMSLLLTALGEQGLLSLILTFNLTLPKLLFNWLDVDEKFAFNFVHLISLYSLSPATTTTIKHPQARHSLQTTLLILTKVNPQQSRLTRRSMS